MSGAASLIRTPNSLWFRCTVPWCRLVSERIPHRAILDPPLVLPKTVVAVGSELGVLRGLLAGMFGQLPRRFQANRGASCDKRLIDTAVRGNTWFQRQTSSVRFQLRSSPRTWWILARRGTHWVVSMCKIMPQARFIMGFKGGILFHISVPFLTRRPRIRGIPLSAIMVWSPTSGVLRETLSRSRR